MAKKKKPKKLKAKRIDWDKQPLGKIADKHLADKLGVTAALVRGARHRRGIELAPESKRYLNTGINWDEQPLGKVDDLELARRIGVHQASVYSARRTRGIPPLKPSPDYKCGPKYIDWDKQPLGKESDALIALMLDVSVGSVALARRKRDIAAYEDRRGITWTND